MTIPEPPTPGPRGPGFRRGRPGPTSGMDPMPGSTPFPGDLGDGVGDPAHPGRRPARPDDVPVPDGTITLVATGRDDRRRHVVDVTSGELGDPIGLRARCGTAVEHVMPGMRAESADCPGCRLDVLR